MFRKRLFRAVSVIRFRRWSRKTDAVFLSLKRHVTIGCVGKSITEASLGKEKCLTTWENFCGERRRCGIPEAEGPEANKEDTFLLRGCLCLVVPVAGCSAGYAGQRKDNEVSYSIKDLFVRAQVARADAVFSWNEKGRVCPRSLCPVFF